MNRMLVAEFAVLLYADLPGLLLFVFCGRIIPSFTIFACQQNYVPHNIKPPFLYKTSAN
jgi:hypothetical protein